MMNIVKVNGKGLWEVKTEGDKVHVNPAFVYTWDGEFWTVDVDHEEDEAIPIPAGVPTDCLTEIMEGVVLPHLGCEGEAWMDME